MSADDDPEQRIRDLERGLSARASELSSSGSEQGAPQYGYVDSGPPPYIPSQDPYPPPPPPPPPGVGAYESAFGSQSGGYGSAYPPPPSYTRGPVNFGGPVVRSSGSFRWVGLLFVIIPLVGLVIGGIVFWSVYQTANDVTSQFDSYSSGVPGISVGSGESTARPSGAPVTVMGASSTQTVTCEGGGIVNISGVSNNVTVTGECDEVNVSGVENIVSVDSSAAIDASGVGNEVTYKRGSPVISAFGDNLVRQG